MASDYDYMLFVDAGSDHVNIGTSSDLGGVLNVSGTGVFQTADNTNNVQIGGGSGVIKNIPDNSKVMGYPSKDLRQFLKDNK